MGFILINSIVPEIDYTKLNSALFEENNKRHRDTGVNKWISVLDLLRRRNKMKHAF